MKLFYKIALLLFVLFSLAFVLADYFGVFGDEFFKSFFDTALDNGKGIYYISSLIAILLTLDLFLPLPSSILMTLAGYYAGFTGGFIASFIGAMGSAWLGFGLCRVFGARFYQKAAGEEGDKIERLFETYGPWIIILSRGFPMLTEIISCLAGLSKMRFLSFSVFTIIGTLPFCAVYAWAGSVGHEDNATAIIVSLGVPGLTFALWNYFKKLK